MNIPCQNFHLSLCPFKKEMDWHVRFGIASFALLIFRMLWGFVGSRYARFAQLDTSPAKTLAYLRGPQHKEAGHNPLGAWSVVAMLALLLVQSRHAKRSG